MTSDLTESNLPDAVANATLACAGVRSVVANLAWC